MPLPAMSCFRLTAISVRVGDPGTARRILALSGAAVFLQTFGERDDLEGGR